MTTKKLLGAAAFTVALAGGGVAGALLGAPGIIGAQESTTTTEPDADAGEVNIHHRGGPHLEAAADALGMTEDELRAELEAGKTIADVAGERGVDVDTVIDAIVAAVTEDVREHVTDLVNGEAPRRGPGRGGHHGFGFRAGFDAVADAIGISEDDLHAALRDGQTIAEVAGANGVDVQAVVDAMVAEVSARIDEQVAEGDLTQEEADELKADLAERLTDVVNGEIGLRRGPGGFGFRRP
jgi:hypothetical protein